MTKKKATIIMEGNSIQIEQMQHELSKIVSQANKQPELTATMQSEEMTDDYNTEFKNE